MMIPFNKPFLTGKETQYIQQAVQSGKISGNGDFTKKCQAWFEQRYGFTKTLLTTSCTDALEMAAILLDLQPGDEVIVPAYTFVSTANAFVLRGAKLVFADSQPGHPNMDASRLEKLITPRTRAIVPVHYAGMACDMDAIMALADKYNLFVVEDAAQAVDAYYLQNATKTAKIREQGRPLGSLGHLEAFSFHETKNIIAGEGGMLVINDSQFAKRAEIIWEKGTNRAAFWRGEVDKYGWVDVGSSFLPSEVIAAFLYAQIENTDKIQQQRIHIWNRYYEELMPLQEQRRLKLPWVPPYTTNNAHMFYLILENAIMRDRFINYLKQNGVLAVFHYLSLHKSPFYKQKHDERELPWSDYYSDCFVRLPLFYELSDEQQGFVINLVKRFFKD